MAQSEIPLLSQDVDVSQDLLREAMAALRKGDLLKAGEYGEKARDLEQTPQVLIVFAAVSHAVGRDLDALNMLERAMQQAPDVANYPDAAAAILLKLGRKTDGLFNLKLGTHLPSDPFLDEIIGDYFGDIEKILPDFLEDRPIKTADLMMRQGLYASAIHQLENYVGVSGGDAESFALIAECALHLGALEEAKVALSALSALDPAHPKRQSFEVGVALLKGDRAAFDSAMKALQSPHSIEEAMMRYRIFAPSPLLTPKMRGELQQDVFKLVGTTQAVLPFDSADWNQTLTVGFMCSGINSVFEGVILNLQERLPVNLYITSHLRNPGLQRLRAGVQNVRDVMTVDDETLVETIRQDQNSFLVDCVGFSQFGRPNIWKLRMAPFQLLWSHNLALLPDCPVYDYQITGGVGLEQLGKKALDLGPSISYPLPPAEVMGNLAKLRAMKVSREKGAENTCRLLVPHLNPALIDQTLETYFTILEQLPKATLAFIAVSNLEDPLVRRVLAFADAKGVAGRVDLIDPALFMQSRYEILHDSDLVLDSFPYGNGDLVSECTWIGVPVLTLAGKSMAEGAPAAVLQSIGIAKLVASSVDDFVKRAVHLGASRRELRATRSQLLKVQEGMSLQYYEGAVAVLFEKIQSLWADWCGRRR